MASICILVSSLEKCNVLMFQMFFLSFIDSSRSTQHLREGLLLRLQAHERAHSRQNRIFFHIDSTNLHTFFEIDDFVKDILHKYNIIDFNQPGFGPKKKALVRNKTHSRYKPMCISRCGRLVTILTPSMVLHLSSSVIHGAIRLSNVIIVQQQHSQQI